MKHTPCLLITLKLLICCWVTVNNSTFLCIQTPVKMQKSCEENAVMEGISISMLISPTWWSLTYNTSFTPPTATVCGGSLCMEMTGLNWERNRAEEERFPLIKICCSIHFKKLRFISCVWRRRRSARILFIIYFMSLCQINRQEKFILVFLFLIF